MRGFVQKLTPHYLFIIIFTAGLALRLLAELSYHSSLLFLGDSLYYLQDAETLSPVGFHPLGYAFFLKLLGAPEHVLFVPIAQHLLGLIAGLLIYLLLLRLGLVRWLAALGTVPILLSGYIINLENLIMPETLTGFLIVIIFTLLFWPKTVLKRTLIAVGLLAAFLTITRSAMMVIIVPLAVYIIVNGLSSNQKPKRVALSVAILLGSFGLPLVGYSLYHYSFDKNFAIDNKAPFFLYGKLAPLADCERLNAAQVKYCSNEHTVNQRHTTDWYLFAYDSPLREASGVKDGPFLPQEPLSDFNQAVLKNQPLDYVRAVLGSTLEYFLPQSVKNSHDSDPRNLQFPTDRYWTTFIRFYSNDITEVRKTTDQKTPVPAQKAATFLHEYQRFAYLPGPILGLSLLASLVAFIKFRNRLTATSISLSLFVTLYLLLASALTESIYRFVLPVEGIAFVAGIIAFHALRQERQKLTKK